MILTLFFKALLDILRADNWQLPLLTKPVRNCLNIKITFSCRILYFFACHAQIFCHSFF